ncbi:MAG: antibiotic biosynthesis monooxygenase [SAR202 cluster bacterium]|nr:antibiotic biosynthesis monooxygenase [SAR202 cluster bacterium]
MYVALGAVRIKPGMRDRFVKALEEHARRSRTEEPGCLRFELVQDGNDPDVVWFYEVCTDAAAFEAHKRTDHFFAWQKREKALAVGVLPGSFEGGLTIYPKDEEWDRLVGRRGRSG